MDRSTLSLLLIVLFAFSTTSVHCKFVSGKPYAAVYDPNSQQWSINAGKSGVVWGVFGEYEEKKGWNTLNLNSNKQFSDSLQAYGSGYLEGRDDAVQHATQFATVPFGQRQMGSINGSCFLHRQALRSITSILEDEAAFWSQVALVMAQFDGLFEGYSDYASTDEQISYVQLLALQASAGDLSDILVKLNISQIPEDYFSQMMQDSHCSVLVKPSEDGMHLYASHVTWTGFAAMVRIYKHYNLPFSLASTKVERVSFSSTPGSIVSGDDFYITDNQLVIMETTNSVMNMSLYDYVTEKTVLYWIRNTVANRMSNTGQEWAKWFAMYNSGTYNNQWIIVDYKLFTPGQPLLPGTLWIAEQIPGYVIGADETNVLSQSGYWASYNVPFFPFVYNISGYPEYAKKYPWGDLYSYSNCPRAKIFRRDQNAVSTLDDMKAIMRYNQWQTDPLSLGNACLSISARCDLNPPANNPGPFGAIDGKVTDERLSNRLESKAVCGPTWDSQPVFAWTSEWQQTAHYGQPQVFDYDWETMKPLIA